LKYIQKGNLDLQQKFTDIDPAKTHVSHVKPNTGWIPSLHFTQSIFSQA